MDIEIYSNSKNPAAEEFKNFGFEHLFTIALIIGISILIPTIIKTTKESLSIKDLNSLISNKVKL